MFSIYFEGNSTQIQLSFLREANTMKGGGDTEGMGIRVIVNCTVSV